MNRRRWQTIIKDTFMQKFLTLSAIVLIGSIVGCDDHPARVRLIHYHTARGEVAEVKKLIASDRNLVNAIDSEANAFTPLHTAAETGQAAVAELLLANGACADAKDSYKYTPAHTAAKFGHKNILEVLFKYKTNIHTIGTIFNIT